MVWQVRPVGRVASLLGTAWGLSITVGAGVAFFGHGAVGLDGVTTVLVLAGFTAFCWGSARSRVTLDDEWITVRNPLWTHRVKLGEIASVTPGYSGLRIVTRDGRKVTAWAVQKSNWEKWRSTHTRADEAAATITRRSSGN